jgi:hypothetical protein
MGSRARLRVGVQCARAGLMALALLAGAVAADATSVVPPEFSQLVNDSDYIVRAVVKSVHSEYARPGSRKIVTFVELDVQETIAGTPPRPLVLRTLGGKVGEDELVLEGAPEFKVGDESIYFVRGNGKQVVPLVAMMHGVYPISRDQAGRTFVTRSNKVPLRNTAEVSAPMTEGVGAKAARDKSAVPALTPQQFIQQIRAAVKPDNARLHER